MLILCCLLRSSSFTSQILISAEVPRESVRVSRDAVYLGGGEGTEDGLAF